MEIIAFKDGEPLSSSYINHNGFVARSYEFADSSKARKLILLEQGARVPMNSAVAFRHDDWSNDAAELHYVNMLKPFCCDRKVLVYSQLHFYP